MNGLMPAIEMKGISMSFDGVEALKNVDFSVQQGEIHGLAGKNGAGKSTLMKVLTGVHTQTHGTIRIFGEDIEKHMHVRSRERWISMIFQEFSLIPELSVVQNIYFNAEPKRLFLIRDGECERIVRDFFQTIDLQIDPREKVKNLSTAEMQLVEISKSVLKQKKILIMDEPTAALEMQQKERLFTLIRLLKEQGVSIIFITHNLDDMMKISDRVSVIRNAERVLTKDIGELSLNEVIDQMLGDKQYVSARRSWKQIDASSPLLSVRNLSCRGRVKNVTFQLSRGEVLGLAGLKGSGQTDILNELFGVTTRGTGEIRIGDRQLTIRRTKDAIAKGIILVPGNRQVQGLILRHSLYFNVTLPILRLLRRLFLINDRKGSSIVQEFVNRLEIKMSSIASPVSSLSGGNQQKVVLSKALATHPSIMLLDDPTFGVDIHAKSEIVKIVEEFAVRGNGVLFVSSDLEELLLNCDRILVIKNGEITKEFADVLKGGLTLRELTATVQA
jgi:ribose transport system ATP-binding protein